MSKEKNSDLGQSELDEIAEILKDFLHLENEGKETTDSLRSENVKQSIPSQNSNREPHENHFFSPKTKIDSTDKTATIRKKIKDFLGDKPRSLSEIHGHINSVMEHPVSFGEFKKRFPRGEFQNWSKNPKGIEHKQSKKVGDGQQSEYAPEVGRFDLGRIYADEFDDENKQKWRISFMEARNFLSENPTNERVLAWLEERGWSEPSRRLLSHRPETRWRDGFDHLNPFHLALEIHHIDDVRNPGTKRINFPTLLKNELEYKMMNDRERDVNGILKRMQDDGLHLHQSGILNQLFVEFVPEKREPFESTWAKFPLTPNHLDTNQEFQFQQFKNGEQMVRHHQQRSQNLQDFCRDIRSRFQTFPFHWSIQDFSMLRSMYSQCRIIFASSVRGDEINEWLTEVISEYSETAMNPGAAKPNQRSFYSIEPLHQTEIKSMTSTLNLVLLILGQLCRQNETSTLSAIHFATSLERFHLTKSRMHFLQLLDSFEVLTKPRNRGSFLDEIPTNRLHPCYEFDDPVFGTHLFMNMAVLEMVRQNPSILGEKRMEPFLKPTTMYLNKDLFEDNVPCSHGTRSIHRHDSASSKFWDLQDHYRSLLKKSSDSMSGSSVSLNKNEKEQEENIQPDNEMLVLYGQFPEFEDVEHHQYAFRHNIRDKYQARAERKKRNKQSERDFLSSYGDMAVPNPLRAFDSDDVSQLPQNALEAIERVSTNPKNQGLRTQNRLVCLLDMVWANLHRRESFGNRFVGLDLLEELESISLTMPENRVAELLFFHQQKILRLYDKPGKEDLSRTNKLSRNNLYARILHQFRLFLQEPSESIDHLARPPAKSSLRRMLHPIRLQTGKDLPLEDLPYDVVMSIVLSRMETLVDELEEVFQIYMWRLTDLSNTDRYDAPSHVHGAMFRSLAVMLGLEICQVHMMVQYLGRGKKWKKSHMYYNQTKLAIEGNGFDAIKDDFVADIRFDVDAYGDGTESIAAVLEGQGVPMPLELLQRLNHYCYSAWGAEDATRKSLTQDELKLVASMNLFVHNDEPTGMDYVHLVRDFDRLYVNHGPKFMSPGRFAFNSFEYF